jgi:integrase
MLGSRPLTEKELQKIDGCFSTERDRIFFQLCTVTGLRPKEALSLKVADVLEQDRVLLHKRYSKAKVGSRSLFVPAPLKARIAQYVLECGLLAADPLFKSREGGPVSRVQVWRGVKEAAFRAGLLGKVALHSGRKTFASHIYNALGKDIVKTAKALGHRNINSTVSYLSFDTRELDAVIVNGPWMSL